MTELLRKYLEFERLMLVLDEDGSPGADALRDLMDPIWYRLTDEERRLLNDRTIGRIKSIEEIRVPSANSVFGSPPDPVEDRAFPPGPITGWKLAA